MNGIIKKSKSIYKNANLSLEDRFITPENRSKEWVYKALKVLDTKGIKGFFQKASLLTFTKTDNFWNNVLYLIENFTLKDTTKEENLNTIKWLKKRYPIIIKSIEFAEEENQLVFKLRGRKDFRATKLSYAIPKTKELFPEIETEDRYHHCHFYSIITALNFDEIEIVTGEVWKWTNKNKYLHSWIECELKGKGEYCADVTKNLLVRKDIYYKMNHIKPLERIKSKKIKEDFSYLAPLSHLNNLYSKLYLSSRDEAMEVARKLEKEGKLKREEKEKN